MGKLTVTSIELAKERIFHTCIRFASDMMIQAGVSSDNLNGLFTDGHNEETGTWVSCMLLDNEKSHFTISRNIEDPVIRIVFENIPTQKGMTTIDFLIKFDEETGVGKFEFVPIVVPSETEDATMMIPYAYMVGAFSGMMERMQESIIYTNTPEVD